MRNEHAQASTGPKDVLVAGVMDLAFVIAALLSLGGAASKNAAFPAGSARPEAAAVTATTTSSVEMIAESRPGLRPR